MLNVQVKCKKFKVADILFQAYKYFDVFKSKDRSLCIKLIFVGMNLTILDKDEKVKGGARDQVTIKY